MDISLAVIITLIIYNLLLISIGIWTSRLNKNISEFHIGGHQLGPFVAALSSLASSSSAWTLLGISGLSYTVGLSALWLIPGTIIGFVLNWYVIAPRLRQLAHENLYITLVEALFDIEDQAWKTRLKLTATLIISVSFIFYVAAQFEAAGITFSSMLGLSKNYSMLIGMVVILTYTFLGGFWAVSVTDTIQGLLMFLSAIILPVAGIVAIGGLESLWSGLVNYSEPDFLSISGAHIGWAAAGMILGTMGIGLGWTGQPHIMVRYMALKDDRAMRQARWVAWTWTLFTYTGMLLLGLCGRLLISGLDNQETVFFELSQQLLAPILAGVMTAAVLSAIMSTADSQLLVVTSSLSHDMGLDKKFPEHGLFLTRIVVVCVCVSALIIAYALPERVFDRVLFAWHALAAAFGPLIFARIAHCSISAVFSFAAMLTGFGITVLFNWQANTPGDVIERLLPYAVSGGVVLYGCFKYHAGRTDFPVKNSN